MGGGGLKKDMEKIFASVEAKLIYLENHGVDANFMNYFQKELVSSIIKHCLTINLINDITVCSSILIVYTHTTSRCYVSIIPSIALRRPTISDQEAVGRHCCRTLDLERWF